jgi:hypothetical protein
MPCIILASASSAAACASATCTRRAWQSHG